MSDQFLLFYPMSDGSNDYVVLPDEETLIDRAEALARAGTPVKACRLVPVELSVSVKARLIKRRSKNSTAADLREAVPPVPSREAAVEVVPKDSHREAEPGDRVAGADAFRLTEGPAHAPEQNRAPSSGDASDGEKDGAPKPDSVPESSVCAALKCEEPRGRISIFCRAHADAHAGGVAFPTKAQAALRNLPAGPLVPHD